MINWENRYRNEGAIWTYISSNTAETAARWFRHLDKKSVYIIGSGYGRNVPPFLKHQLSVCGNDISKTACQMAEEKFPNVPFIAGSYLETQIVRQEAIYCFDVLHCIGKEEQVLFIKKMYEDLLDEGVAYVTVLSNVAQMTLDEKMERTLFSEKDLLKLCALAPFEIEAIIPYTDMFHSQAGLVKQYPLLCAKLRK